MKQRLDRADRDLDPTESRVEFLLIIEQVDLRCVVLMLAWELPSADQPAPGRIFPGVPYQL